MHNRPLRRCHLPPAFRFLLRQLHHTGSTYVGFQAAVFDEDPAPYNLSRLADGLHGAAAGGKIHGRLAFAYRATVAVDEMFGRSRAGDLEDPHEPIVERFAVSHIVQGRLRMKPELSPEAIGDQSVEP